MRKKFISRPVVLVLRLQAKALCLFVAFSLPFVLCAQDIDLLILNGDYSKALEMIDNQLEKEASAGLYYKKGVVHGKLLDIESAIPALRKACTLDGGKSVYYEELAEAYSALGNYHDAAASLKKAVDMKPADLRLMGKLAQIHVNMKAYDEACKWYSDIYEQDSTNMFYNRYFAYAAYRAGKTDMAVKLYEQLVEKGTRDLNTYLNLATIYNKKEDMVRAVRACMNGFLVFPDDPSLLLKLGDTYFQHKTYELALQPYGKYLETGDSIPNMLKNYGICLYSSGKEEAALKVLEQVYLLMPADPILNFYIGVCHKKLKQFAESEVFLGQAADVAIPFYLSNIYHNLAQVYGQQREFEKAIAAYNEALKLDPSKVELLFEIATTYEEFNSNKTMALNYYQIYLNQAGLRGKNAEYAAGRIKKLKEDLFFD